MATAIVYDPEHPLSGGGVGLLPHLPADQRARCRFSLRSGQRAWRGVRPTDAPAGRPEPRLVRTLMLHPHGVRPLTGGRVGWQRQRIWGWRSSRRQRSRTPSLRAARPPTPSFIEVQNPRGLLGEVGAAREEDPGAMVEGGRMASSESHRQTGYSPRSVPRCSQRPLLLGQAR